MSVNSETTKRIISMRKQIEQLKTENERLRDAINRAITILPLAKTDYVIDELLQALKANG